MEEGSREVVEMKGKRGSEEGRKEVLARARMDRWQGKGLGRQGWQGAEINRCRE